jgi:hypothetical protein
MARFTTYDPATGEILASHHTQDGVIIHDDNDQVDGSRHYVQDGVILLRPELEVAARTVPIGLEPVTLAETLPPGTTVEVDGLVVDESGGEPLTFLPDTSGVYDFVLTPPFPWRRARFSVTVEVTVLEEI